MGDRPICLLRGHGVTVTGADVPEAVLRSVALETLAGVTPQTARLGVRPEPVSEADLAELPDLGAEFNVSARWRSLLAAAS